MWERVAKKNLSSWDKKCPLSLVRIQLLCSAATWLGFLLAGVLTWDWKTSSNNSYDPQGISNLTIIKTCWTLSAKIGDRRVVLHRYALPIRDIEVTYPTYRSCRSNVVCEVYVCATHSWPSIGSLETRLRSHWELSRPKKIGYSYLWVYGWFQDLDKTCLVSGPLVKALQDRLCQGLLLRLALVGIACPPAGIYLCLSSHSFSLYYVKTLLGLRLCRTFLSWIKAILPLVKGAWPGLSLSGLSISSYRVTPR